MILAENTGSIPFTVFVEGNVGAGKSTLLNHFKNLEDFLVLEEPIEKWQNLHGKNLLELKFQLPDHFQFPFQSYATLTRLRQHLQVTDKPIKMMERSLLTARRCFVNMLYETGKMNEGNFHVLNEWYDFVNEYHKIRCDLIIYLRTTPDVAYTRVTQRAREEETTVDFSYLSAIHSRHEDLLIHSSKLPTTPIVILDANMPNEEIPKEYQRCNDEIMKYFYKSLEIKYGDKTIHI